MKHLYFVAFIMSFMSATITTLIFHCLDNDTETQEQVKDIKPPCDNNWKDFYCTGSIYGDTLRLREAGEIITGKDWDNLVQHVINIENQLKTK